jgi:membrane protease YdiL (CAAX protease family)
MWAAGFAAGAVVWSAAPELQMPARLLTATLLGPAPVAFMMQARVTQSLPLPVPRLSIYAGSMLVLWMLAALAYAASVFSNLTMRALGLASLPGAQMVLWTLAAVACAALIVVAFRAAGMRETAIMHEIIPVTKPEKAVFCGLSITAGICEELAFRGFLLTAVALASGSVPAGVLLSSIAFGALHAHQNAAGTARAALLGAALCIPLLVTGSIYPSMAAHALIDIAGGLWLGKWMLR